MDRFDVLLEIGYLQLEGSEIRYKQFMSGLQQDKTQTIQDIQDNQELDRLDRKIKRLYDILEQERKASRIQRYPRRKRQVKPAQPAREEPANYTPRTPYRLSPCETYDSSEPSTDFEETKHLAKALVFGTLTSRQFSFSNQPKHEPKHESPPFSLSERTHEYNQVRYSDRRGFGFHPFDPGGHTWRTSFIWADME